MVLTATDKPTGRRKMNKERDEMKWYHWVLGISLFLVVPYAEPIADGIIAVAKMVMK